jgi:hypothetical protein
MSYGLWGDLPTCPSNLPKPTKTVWSKSILQEELVFKLFFAFMTASISKLFSLNTVAQTHTVIYISVNKLKSF